MFRLITTGDRKLMLRLTQTGHRFATLVHRSESCPGGREKSRVRPGSMSPDVVPHQEGLSEFPFESLD